MEYKILESTGVEITHIDGAAFNNFSAGSENGILAGVMEECKVSLESSDTVKISTGELLIQGFRVKITSPYSITKPSNLTNINYYLIARLVVLSTGGVTFTIQARQDNTLAQEDIFRLEYGTYEIELARFIVGQSGITDLSQTVKIISGPAGSGGGLTPEQLEQFNALVKWYEDSHYKTMTVSISPSSLTYEIGPTSLTKDITFTWSFSNELSSLTFRGNTLPTNQTSETVTGISSTSSYTVKGTRKDGNKETKSATASVYFYNRYYFGYAPDPGIIDSTFIKTLTYKKGWADSRKTFTATPNCPTDNYIWYAYPSRLGASKFKLNGFNANFVLSTVKFTNDSGYEEEYYVYRSVEHSLGSIEVQVL